MLILQTSKAMQLDGRANQLLRVHVNKLRMQPM
jgi:hypothetical protein